MHTYIHTKTYHIHFAGSSHIYCTYYRMHFLFFFLFILCTPIYPFFISFLCIHYHIYFCWQHLPALLLFSADGYIFFAFLFVCTFHISFLVFDIYFKFVFCILVLFIFFTSFLFFFCFSFVFLLFFYFLLFLWYIWIHHYFMRKPGSNASCWRASGQLKRLILYIFLEI